MILDASVAAKWFLKREKYGSDAIRLRQDYEAGKVDLSAPSLILYEDCSAIRKIKDIAREKASKLAEAASTYLGNIVLSPPKAIGEFFQTLGPGTYRCATHRMLQ